MPLRLKLSPGERVVINGCVVCNGDRRTTLTIQNFAAIIREDDILTAEKADTPVKAAYYLIQTALLDSSAAEKVMPEARAALARLYVILFSEEMKDRIMEAANHANTGDYYKALAALRPVIAYEEALLEAAGTAAAEDTVVIVPDAPADGRTA